MSKMRMRLASLVLALVLLVTGGGLAFAETAPAEAEEGSTPLVYGVSGEFSEKFSPFFADTTYDVNVVEMTQGVPLTTDRMGGIVYNGIEGETIPYNGTDYTYSGPADVTVDYDEASEITTYTVKLREDLVFSDGTPVSADDLIFTYYVLCDPTYVGSTTLNSYDIIGLKNYQTQTTDDVYAQFSDLAAQIREAGEDHEWADTDAWTKEQQEGFWAIQKQLWTNDAQDIVNYCLANYIGYAEDYTGYTADEINADEGMQVMFGMAMWGFGEVADGVLTGTTTGKTWDLNAGERPSIDDYYAESYAKYEGDAAAFSTTETTGNGTFVDVVSGTSGQFISQYGAATLEGGVPNITGIKKLDQYTVEVKVNGFSAPAVYAIAGIYIVPMHYYGDPAQYDYENNQFGFPFGDLSIVESKTTQPMGMGPYKFVKYENRTVYFEANELYYKGAPKTKYVQFVESDQSQMVAGVATATIDIGEPSASKSVMSEIAGYNTDTSDITGNVVTTSLIDYLGYGYIGINADTVNVGGVPDSEESKNLRKAFATVLSVYRDVAVDSYYGPAASIINYPISNTSWAAPQKTDSDYHVSYSLDVDGNEIYTADMTAEDKYVAALEAAKNYLIAAGYTFDEATGLFTAAPEGAKLEYEIYVGGDGIGDHPSFAVLTAASAALESIGITLKVNDLTDTNIMWDALDAGTQEMWCAAWQQTIDPDMYQIYHSSGIVGKGGSDSNHYHIANSELDELIVEARVSDDQSFRKAIYKQCFDIIMDWAVELPVYQRKECYIFSSERINTDTLTPDMTTYWGWLKEVELIEMN